MSKVSTEAKEAMKGKLNAAVEKDLKNTKIEREIRNVKETDGKLTANYEVRGNFSLKSNGLNDSGRGYHDYPKIFNNYEEFNSYTKAFFDADSKQIAEIIKNK